MVHNDGDFSEFTLAYVSNPNTITNENATVDFLIDGRVIPLKDGELFSFRGEDSHGTGYRLHTVLPAMVMGITRNKNYGRVSEKLLKL